MYVQVQPRRKQRQLNQKSALRVNVRRNKNVKALNVEEQICSGNRTGRTCTSRFSRVVNSVSSIRKVRYE
ncbi:hypothetical protein, partial [Escherichia coli]|uniref:hypothetical protein n=1 Tax=Escherichia coli TaxID=562 RepID=UPI001BC89F48